MGSRPRQQIELDKQEVERRQTELDVADQFLSEVTEKYQRLTQQLQDKKYEILSAARKEAQQILADANRTVENTISTIKEAKAERETTMKARQQMKAEAERIALDQERHDEEHAKSVKEMAAAEPLKGHDSKEEEDGKDIPIGVGSIVRIDGQETFAQVVELKGKKAVVESNSIRMTIALSRLSGTKKKAIPSERQSRQTGRFQSIYDDINEKRKSFAQLLSEKELRLLHGKGYGILKQIIRDYLQGSRDVQSFHSERLELGGDGITVVHMK